MAAGGDITIGSTWLRAIVISMVARIVSKVVRRPQVLSPRQDRCRRRHLLRSQAAILPTFQRPRPETLGRIELLSN